MGQDGKGGERRVSRQRKSEVSSLQCGDSTVMLRGE